MESDNTQQQPAAADPSSSSSSAAPEYSPPVSRISGKPMRQEDVDALYAIIDEEIEIRHRMANSLNNARIPLSFNHSIAVCQDGTLWQLSGEGWHQVGAPIPGSMADNDAKREALEKDRAAERERLQAGSATAKASEPAEDLP